MGKKLTFGIIYKCLSENPDSTQKEIVQILSTSISTLKRVLSESGQTFRALRESVRMRELLTPIRNNAKSHSLKKTVLLTSGTHQDNYYKYIRNHFGCTITQYKEEMNAMRSNQLTNLEFSTLKQELKALLTMKSHTLKELMDITKRSRAYVIAALRELPSVIGGNGSGTMVKGYCIPSVNNYDAYKTVHDSWVTNWRASMNIQ